MQIPASDIKKRLERFSYMRQQRLPWEKAWKELSNFFLPRRYLWLLTDKEYKTASVRNTYLLDSTSILALRTLATGMMNGITSPARPWFRLSNVGEEDVDQQSYDEAVWFDAATKIMLDVMSRTNFYNAFGILYLEWPCFGTAGLGIYENEQDIFSCYNYAVGEFFLETDYNGRVVGLGREFVKTVEQVVDEFGLENVSSTVRADYIGGGTRRTNPVTLVHLTEPNSGLVRKSAAFQDLYWEKGRNDGKLLRVSPLDEFPHVTPRWEVYAADTYGSSPCMDALPDVLQLQQLIKRRAQALDKLVSPPMLFNKSLAGRARSTLPNGETFVNGQDLTAGGRPLYQIQVPFGELNLDIQTTRGAIREVLFNDLFRMISSLETVRSATEIDARREEKLVLLGPVLDRFFNEALTPALRRIFNICLRRGLFPPPPKSLSGTSMQIYYTGVLSDAQRAVGTAPIERYLQVLGNMVTMYPEDVMDVPDPEEILREYANAIGLKTKLQRSRDATQALRDGRKQQQQMQEGAALGGSLVAGAKQLSETDLGGGASALQVMLGNGT